MSFIDERKALTREKRISTLSHFDGTLETLKDESQGPEIKQKVRTFTQVSYDEILYAVSLLSKIDQAAVVIHGAVGCSASGLFYNEEKSFHWYSSNLNERDTILGGDEKLRKAVFRAYEETRAKTIFIVGTPVVAINNDDVNSIIMELEEELEIKLINIYTDGFKTKTPVTGYDIVAHSLLRYVVDRSQGEGLEKDNFINVISFSENRENLAAVLTILKDLGITYRLLPQYADIDSIAGAGKAKASVTLSAEEGAYFAEGLEDVFHVPYVRTKAPVGIRATRHFILKLAKQLGIVEKAEEYIRKQEDDARKYFKNSILTDKKVFLDSTLENIPGLVEIVEKLGGNVEGIGIPYIDLENRVNLEKLKELRLATPVIVGNGQPYEKANIIAKKGIDYYIGEKGSVSFAAGQGSIPVSIAKTAFYAYEGIRQFTSLLAEAEIYEVRTNEQLYKDSWLKKSSNWYVKQEVK